MISFAATFLDLYQSSSWLGKFAIILAVPASFLAVMSILENIRAIRNHQLQEDCEKGYKLLGPAYTKQNCKIIPNNGAPLIQYTTEPYVLVSEEMKKEWEEWAVIVIKKIPSSYKHRFKNPPDRRHWPQETYALKMHYSRLDVLEKIIEENNNTLSIGVNINFVSNKVN